MPDPSRKVPKGMPRHERENLLKPHADTLVKMNADKRTFFEMIQWLEKQGVKCSYQDLGHFFRGRPGQQQEGVMDNIALAAKLCHKFEQMLDENPTPELAMLAKLHRLLIFRLCTEEEVNHESIKLADQLMRTAILFTTNQAKLEQSERALKLSESTFQIKFCEQILDQVLRDAAERIATSNLSQAEKIAAMRQVAFKDVEALQQSGQLIIPA
jgi:hypothetical protein